MKGNKRKLIHKISAFFACGKFLALRFSARHGCSSFLSGVNLLGLASEGGERRRRRGKRKEEEDAGRIAERTRRKIIRKKI